MKNRVAFVGLAAALCLICGCAVSPLYSLFITKTASDEEAFPQAVSNTDDIYVDLPDPQVPLGGTPFPEDDNWLLVRYEENEDGTVSLIGYRVLEDGTLWGEELFTFEEPIEGLHLTLP